MAARVAAGPLRAQLLQLLKTRNIDRVAEGTKTFDQAIAQGVLSQAMPKFDVSSDAESMCLAGDCAIRRAHNTEDDVNTLFELAVNLMASCCPDQGWHNFITTENIIIHRFAVNLLVALSGWQDMDVKEQRSRMIHFCREMDRVRFYF